MAKPKKVSSERGVATPLTDDSEVIDAEIVYETEPPLPPTGAEGEERKLCLYCERAIHAAPLPDRFGLTCPGETGAVNPKSVQKYLMMREFCEDQEKIDDLDVDALKDFANKEYEGRKRSDVTISELQADIDMRLGRLRPKMKLRENLPSDGPDIEIPHITLPNTAKPGKTITVSSKRPNRIRTQAQQREDAARNSRIVHASNEAPFGTAPMPNPSEVPPDRRNQEYDQMIFINKDMKQ